MRVARVLCATALLAAGLSGPAMAAPSYDGLPYRIAAERGASYQMTCKFRAIRVYGQLRGNQYRILEKGPSRGNLPSDNARCVLVKLSGPGEVVLTIVKQTPRVARAVQPNQPVKLTVL